MVLSLGDMAKRIAKLEDKVKALENKKCDCDCKKNPVIAFSNPITLPLLETTPVYPPVITCDGDNINVGEDLTS